MKKKIASANYKYLKKLLSKVEWVYKMEPIAYWIIIDYFNTSEARYVNDDLNLKGIFKTHSLF